MALQGRRAGGAAGDPLLDAVLAADRSPAYNTAAVARRTGLLPATFRVWERRYGFPSPTRLPRGQRLYSERDVQALIWLRERQDEGLTISAALALLRQQLDHPRDPAVRDAAPDARPPAALALDLERALLAFDEATAEAVLAEAFALYSLERACLEVIQQALVAVGEGWHVGRADVAQEHFGSSLIRRRLTELLRLVNPALADRVVLTACPPDEWHELGLIIVALFLARRGRRVVYLGASLPPEDLLAAVKRLRPEAVVLSGTRPESAAAVASVAGRLAELPPPRPLLAFGGQAFETNPAPRDALPGLYLGPNAQTAADRLDRALAAGRA